MLRALGWIVGGLVGLAVLGLVSIALLNNFGVVESRYRCEGVTFGEAGASNPTVMYLKLELFRPVIFWADDDGSAWTEVPNGAQLYYESVRVAGDHVNFSTSDNMPHGDYSRLADSMWVSMEGRMFEGSCVRAPEE